jgi:hypothetical protein
LDLVSGNIVFYKNCPCRAFDPKTSANSGVFWHQLWPSANNGLISAGHMLVNVFYGLNKFREIKTPMLANVAARLFAVFFSVKTVSPFV